MMLKELRGLVRAGKYRDDLFCYEQVVLYFLRWLYLTGRLTDWR